MHTSVANELMNIARSTGVEGLDAYALHCHDHFEIYYFLSGDVRYLVEGTEYRPTPHSILLMSPGAFHGVRVESSRPYERYAFHFLPELLPENARDLLLTPFYRRGIYYRNASPYRIDWFLDAILECGDMDAPLQEIALQARVLALMTQLQKMASHPVDGRKMLLNSRYSIQNIIAYLNEHLAEEISLQDLAERFYISPNHLNRVFRQATGTTVINYVNHKRIALARQLMRHNQTAAEAAANVGFRDYSTFYRVYKKLVGTSPSGRSHM